MTAPLFGALLAVLVSPVWSVSRQPDSGLRSLAGSELTARTTEAAPTKPAKGRFLVARRSVNDPRFAQTVILLVDYSDRGAMGLIINRPTDVRLATALPKMKELRDHSDLVFVGGPVSPTAMLLLIRSGTPPDGAESVFGDVYVSGSLQTLRAMMGKAGKKQRLRAYAGYAGWGPGQLDREIARGDWAIGLADAASVFETPAADIWPKLLDRFSVEWAGFTHPGPHDVLAAVADHAWAAHGD